MDPLPFLAAHSLPLTAITLLVTYGIARNKFTPGGVVAGISVSIIHMLHPWPVFFWLLTSFVFLGTLVTKIGHTAKTHLTQSSTGSPGSGGEAARTSTQVLANSFFACLLILAHLYLLNSTPFISSLAPISAGPYTPSLLKVLPVGIVVQYAAVAADTFSSELGILAKSEPRLIVAPWKKVAKGTNGGVTAEGLLWGAAGSAAVTAVAVVMFFVSPPRVAMSTGTVAVVTVLGTLGSVIDSLLGAVLQATVTDRKSGRVIEGPGGTRVKVGKGGSRVQQGRDLLTNNGVNFVMAVVTSLIGMGVAYVVDLEVGVR